MTDAIAIEFQKIGDLLQESCRKSEDSYSPMAETEPPFTKRVFDFRMSSRFQAPHVTLYSGKAARGTHTGFQGLDSDP